MIFYIQLLSALTRDIFQPQMREEMRARMHVGRTKTLQFRTLHGLLQNVTRARVAGTIRADCESIFADTLNSSSGDRPGSAYINYSYWGVPHDIRTCWQRHQAHVAGANVKQDNCRQTLGSHFSEICVESGGIIRHAKPITKKASRVRVIAQATVAED